MKFQSLNISQTIKFEQLQEESSKGIIEAKQTTEKMKISTLVGELQEKTVLLEVKEMVCNKLKQSLIELKNKGFEPKVLLEELEKTKSEVKVLLENIHALKLQIQI